MASRLVSSALPRILSSNVAGGSKKGPRFASHDSVVSFDKQDIFPVVFDGNLAVSWMDASLNLNVVATQNAGGTKVSTGLAMKAKKVGEKIPRKTLWQAQGSWKCREVLSDSEFYWTGRIPLFSVGSSKNDSGHFSKKGPETRHIGDIVLTVELISNLLRLPKAVQERPSTPKPVDHGTSSSSEVPMKPEIDNAAEITIEKKHFHLPPHYVFISITTARGLAVFPSLNETSPTLLHLSLRLFSSSTPPTTTPPLPYLPPFDLSTGRLNPPLNFDYAVTVPVAITEAFLEKAKELVVEVWALSPHYPQSRTTFTSADSNDELVGPISTSDALENSTAELIEDGRRLLGLLRLPFDYLVATVAAGLRENGNVSSTEKQTPPDMDPPVLLPEAEYAIVDPFSGISKGWVKAFLALGTWSQIARMQKNGIDGVDVAPQRIAKTETASAPVEPFIPGSRHEQLNAEKQFIERVEKIPKNASVARVDADGQSSASDDPVSCTLQVSVHALCGLRGLLASFIRNRFNDESVFIGSSAADSSTLDVAHSMGPKTYVKIQISLAEFPEPVPENHELFGITTPCAPRSFTPKFNFTETLDIHVIDTKFLRWIKLGGCAVGEVWQQGAEGKDILLGTFKVPLQRLLEKANGVWKEWVLVEAANRMSTESNGVRADAAAQISIQFKNGFGFMDSNNLPSSVNFGSASIDGNRTVCDMKVSISELKLSLADSREDNDSGLFYARWSYPIVTEEGLQQAILKSNTHALSHEESGEWASVHFGWSETVEFEMQTDIFNLLQNSGLKIEVVQKFLNGTESSFGFAKVDLWDAVCRIRKAHRKNDNRFVRVDGVFPVINPSADDLRTASIDVSVELSLSGRERSVFSKKENKADEIAVKPHLQTVADSTIGARMDPTIQITIDRSIQLPKIYGLHPNTYATLTWPLDNTYLSTHIVPNNDSPAWKCEFTVNIPRSEMELRRLKFDCYLVEVIAWHCDETAYDLAAGTADSNRAVKLGSAFVDVSPLFSGCREIHGWYPLTGDNHVQHGQILVRIAPSENLGSALMNAAGPKAEVATFLIVGPAAASSLPPTLALPGLQNGKLEAVGPNASISQNGRQSQEPHPVTSPSSPTAPISMQPLNESMGIQVESHPGVSEQVSTQETADSESVFAIEDFSRSLQKTVDELNALQDLIRSRGLKGLPVFKDALSLHREELEGTQNQALESLSGLAPAEPIAGHEPNHENEAKTAQSEDGDRLTLEDLNFNFEEDQTGSIVKADWSDLIAKAQQHESQGHHSLSLDHDEPGQASGDTHEAFATNSIIQNSHQISRHRNDLNPASTVSPKSVHQASDSESDSDDETDAFILSLLQSQRGSNRSSPFSRSRTSPPQRKLALHDEMKSTAERYMLLSQNESRRRSPLNPSTTAAKNHATTHSDAEKDGSRGSDDGSESDDEDSVFGISTKRTAITFGKPPLHQSFHSQKKPAANSSTFDFDAWETKYKTRSHGVQQTDSRLRQFLHSVDGSDSSVLSHEEESEMGADDSDDFSMVFSSSKKKRLEKEASAKPNDISMPLLIGSSERKKSDSKLKNNSLLLGGRELRYAEDEEIREILYRSRQTRAEALDKVKRMKMQGLPERADATASVSKATAIRNTNSTGDPTEKSEVPDGGRNGEGHQNSGELDARRIAKIFYNNGDSSE
ncbi:C2 domain-containing protein 3 [Chytriomyces hyalinus]|nr:C2 domain-containing protein 3 [Chytriomyces hyalinus]